MKFGQMKCSYLIAEHGKSYMCINGLTSFPVLCKECYKYLGIDESISYEANVNRHRILYQTYKNMAVGILFLQQYPTTYLHCLSQY